MTAKSGDAIHTSMNTACFHLRICLRAASRKKLKTLFVVAIALQTHRNSSSSGDLKARVNELVEHCSKKSELVFSESGDTLKGYCRNEGNLFQPAQIRQWIKSRGKLQAKRRSAKSVSDGRLSTLASIGEGLLQWIFELREQAIALSMSMIDAKVKSILPGFRHKPSSARLQTIRRYLKAHGLSHRVSTHTAQADPRIVSFLSFLNRDCINPRLL